MSTQLHTSLSNHILLLKDFLSHGTISSTPYTNTPTNFYPSLILQIISSLNIEDLKHEKDALAGHLINQKSLSWTWNYRARLPNEIHSDLPDDLDDTCIALAALYLYDPSIIDEEAMVSIVNTLIRNETAEGGPYFTWDVPCEMRQSWKDVDIVVNSNIMHFLSVMGIDLPNLTTFIEDKIKQVDLRSDYYKSPIVIIYFLSKWYRGALQKDLLILLDKETPANPLEKALFISAHINLYGELSTIKRLVDEVILNTEIKNCPVFIEKVTKDAIHWSGCEAFTCTAIIEALSLYDKACHQPIPPLSHNENTELMINNFLKDYPPTISEPILQEFNSFKKLSALANLPRTFYQHIIPDYQSLDGTMIEKLCFANALGWIGYTFYDDVLDDGKIKDLPAANICAREMLSIFLSISSDPVIITTLNTIDTANHWEYTHCKCSVVNSVIHLPAILPDYVDHSVLAEKSLGLAIAPLLLILASHHPDKIKEISALESFFRHYLIARQLNDDAHDWFHDLQNGFLNSVSTPLIAQYLQKDNHEYELNLTTEKDALQKLFWYEIIDQVASDVFNHIELARSSLMSITILTDITFLSKLLDPLEESTEKALSERDSALRFLKAYY